MNKVRRKELGKAFDLVDQAKNVLEAVKAEEQEAYENLPDSFRFGERGEEMQGYIEMRMRLLTIWMMPILSLSRYSQSKERIRE